MQAYGEVEAENSWHANREYSTQLKLLKATPNSLLPHSFPSLRRPTNSFEFEHDSYAVSDALRMRLKLNTRVFY